MHMHVYVGVSRCFLSILPEDGNITCFQNTVFTFIMWFFFNSRNSRSWTACKSQVSWKKIIIVFILLCLIRVYIVCWMVAVFDLIKLMAFWVLLSLKLIKGSFLLVTFISCSIFKLTKVVYCLIHSCLRINITGRRRRRRKTIVKINIHKTFIQR
jgi:hypothetical protein